MDDVVARVKAAVKAHPGLNQTHLACVVGVSRFAARRALIKLVAAGQVVAVGPGILVVYFRPGAPGLKAYGIPDGTPELAHLKAFLDKRPGLRQVDVIRHAAAAWGWKRSTTQARLAILEGRPRFS